jgi:hypothetical protein
MDVAATPLSVLDALIACGVDNVALFLEETQAQHIADQVFDGSFLHLALMLRSRSWMNG